MEFLLGCNYWASNAGADMWRKFDEDVIREDLKALSSYGTTHIRVFPNWRDFQPVMPLYSADGVLSGYCLEGDVTADNPYYLDSAMLDRFNVFLELCSEYGIKVVVGLITGWMSGRLYIPSALYGKNILTDHTSLFFQQLFIRGFISKFKSHNAICAWDLGNECNCMTRVNRMEAASWTAAISNAIRAEDPSRIIISGSHDLGVDNEKAWLIKDQAEWCDILTTHPYPFWGTHTKNDNILSLRTTMHATAQNKFYAECGNKPCFAEEIGTMGPMLASNEAAAKFLRTNLFSLWANGSAGVMWWCGHDQTMLTAYPYSANMVELELGLLKTDRSPKPVMLEIKKFSDFLKTIDFTLPEASYDAVCLLTPRQRQWGVAYASHILARQAGVNLRFAYADDGIPESDSYLLPSINDIKVMDSARYKELKAKIYNGANLYLSINNAVLSEFESLTGMRVIDSYEAVEENSFTFMHKDFSFRTNRTYKLESVGAEVLARDKFGNPVISVYNYGKGKVTYFNFPLEDNLIDGHNAFYNGHFELYKYVFSSKLESLPIKITAEGVCSTIHKADDKIYVVAINHTDLDASIIIDSGKYTLLRTLYGASDKVSAFDASVLEFVIHK